ncbi:MAG: hypothetical protein ACR2O1_02015, partial [Boseongicola sp.]
MKKFISSASGRTTFMLVVTFMIIYIGCIGHAVWTDVARMKISNSVSIILCLAFLIFAVVYIPLPSTAVHVGVATAVFAVTFCCFALGA